MRFLNQNRHPSSCFVFLKQCRLTTNTKGRTESCAANHVPGFPLWQLVGQVSCLPAQTCICFLVSRAKECCRRLSTVHVKLVALIYCSLVAKKPFSVSWWTVGCPPKAETTRSLHIPEDNFGVHATRETACWAGD